MGFLNKLFGTSKKQNSESSTQEPLPPKKDFKVYPRIKNTEWQALEIIYNIPLADDLVLTFVQDINDRITYITKEDVTDKDILLEVNKWKENICNVDFELFSTESWENRVYFNQPDDYSNEKVLDPAFIKKACELLNTDKLIISISRRHRMQITSYHEDFQLLERFFFNHFSIWRDSQLDDEVISESVLIAENGKITDVAYMGFRMNLYEKDGSTLLNYSTMDENITGKLDFQEIIERNKCSINLVD